MILTNKAQHFKWRSQSGAVPWKSTFIVTTLNSTVAKCGSTVVSQQEGPGFGSLKMGQSRKLHALSVYAWVCSSFLRQSNRNG